MEKIIREKRELAYEGTIVNVYKDYIEIGGKKSI